MAQFLTSPQPETRPQTRTVFSLCHTGSGQRRAKQVEDLQANIGDWQRVWYRGSYLALGTREAFQGSTGLGGLCFSSDNSWKITLPMPDSSLILEISSISRWIFGSSGTSSSSSSSFSPRLLLRSRTEKNKVHISHANSKCLQRPYTTLLIFHDTSLHS